MNDNDGPDTLDEDNLAVCPDCLAEIATADDHVIGCPYTVDTDALMEAWEEERTLM